MAPKTNAFGTVTHGPGQWGASNSNFGATANAFAASSLRPEASNPFAAPDAGKQIPLQSRLTIAPANVLPTSAQRPKASIWERSDPQIPSTDNETSIASSWVRSKISPTRVGGATGAVPSERTTGTPAKRPSSPANQDQGNEGDAARAMREAARDRKLREVDRAQQETHDRELDRQRRLEHVDAAIAASVVSEHELRQTCAALEIGKLSVPLHDTTEHVPVTFCEEIDRPNWQQLIDMKNPAGVPPQDLWGTCGTMCPAAYVHEITSDLEIVDGQPLYPIKQFKRTVNEDVGNTAPEFLRTKEALHMSMQTLRAWLQGVRGPEGQHSRTPHGVDMVTVRCLVQDRHRSIRQDLDQQNVRSLFAVRILEEMVRYLVSTIHEMSQESRYKDAMGIDKKELSKILLTLDSLYMEHRGAGEVIDTEAEFLSYMALTKTGHVVNNSFRSLAASAEGLGAWLLTPTLPAELLISPPLAWALGVSRAMDAGAWAQFFGLMRQATHVQACFGHLLFLEEARRQRMLELHGSQRPRDRKPPTLPIAEVRDMLLLDSDKQALAWLRPYNPLLCTSSQGEAALLLTRDPATFSGANNAAVQSMYILNKAHDRSIPEVAQAQLNWEFEGTTGQQWQKRFGQGHRHTARRLPPSQPRRLQASHTLAASTDDVCQLAHGPDRLNNIHTQLESSSAPGVLQPGIQPTTQIDCRPTYSTSPERSATVGPASHIDADRCAITPLAGEASGAQTDEEPNASVSLRPNASDLASDTTPEPSIRQMSPAPDPSTPTPSPAAANIFRMPDCLQRGDAQPSSGQAAEHGISSEMQRQELDRQQAAMAAADQQRRRDSAFVRAQAEHTKRGQQQLLAEYRQARTEERDTLRRLAAERQAAVVREKASKSAAKEARETQLHERRRAAAQVCATELTHDSLQRLATAFRRDQMELEELGSAWHVAAWVPDLALVGAAMDAPGSPGDVLVARRAPWSPAAGVEKFALISAGRDEDELASYHSDPESREGSMAPEASADVEERRQEHLERVTFDSASTAVGVPCGLSETGAALPSIGRDVTLLRPRVACQPLTAQTKPEEAARERLQASGFLAALSGAVRGTKRGRSVL